MAFQQALSGLNGAAKAIDVISNNVANASTVGFKNSQAHFADMYAASLNLAGAGSVGIGTRVTAVAQQFTQGNISTTNNPLDIAINGNGFFRMTNNGAVTYSRNGQFHLDKSGYITNDQGMHLTGRLADTNGTIAAGNPSDIWIDPSEMPPVETGQSSSTTGIRGVGAQLNLDSRADLPTGPWANGVSVDPGPAGSPGTITVDPAYYNYSTALSIYDSLGNPHTMTMYFVKQATPGDWQMHVSIDGTQEANVEFFDQISGASLGAPGTPLDLNFDTSGQLTSLPFEMEINLGGVVTDLQAVDPAVPDLAANATMHFDLDFDGSTQYGSPFGTQRLEQDGYSSGRLTGLSASEDGIIQGRYTNGLTRNLAQIVLASFTNPNGLQPLGENQWAETASSGQPVVDAPKTSNLGLVQSGSVEDSNVDLTNELVNMITMQRNYQANAQSIRTQDQMMNTIVNLR